jgi:mRNA-degrading endonuclease toxin of MazEF toxin-antitoxin module
MIQKNQREVWLMKAPYSDYSSTKVRPVIIISNKHYNKNSDDFLAVHITTNKGHAYAMGIADNDFVNGGLLDESVVRFDTLTRYEVKLLVKRIGKISSKFYEKLYSKITGLISPPDS